MAQPTWTVGDYWDYLATWEGFPQPGSMRLTVTGTETVNVGGTAYDSYRVETEGQFLFSPPTTGWETVVAVAWYRASDLSLVKQYVNLTDLIVVPIIWSQTIYITLAVDPPERLVWPLTAGAMWTAAGWVNASWFVVPGPGMTTRRNATVNMSFSVEPERAVTVPSGTYTATPLSGTAGGYANVTYWSPAVGNGVLIQQFAPGGVEIQRLELIGYQYRGGAPITTLVIGAPNVTGGATYVTSATPLSFSVLDPGGRGIRATVFRIDDGPWANYTGGTFTLPGEGTHVLEWYSQGDGGNLEATRSATLTVDDTPPTSSISVGIPKYMAARTYVTSATRVTITAADGGALPVGLAATLVRVWNGTWSDWAADGSPFALAGTDGIRYVEYRSEDLLGNRESVRNETLVLDDTPPTTTLSPASGPYSKATTFTLSATDAGCGVNGTEVRIDAGAWTPYAGGFALAAGDHVVRYRSVDCLNNTEAERELAVNVGSPPPPPPPPPPPAPETNLKPLVAAVFAAILAIAGAWSARRRPWKKGTGGRAMLLAFAFTAIPFVLAEAGTGIISFFIGFLSIPPILGLGTAVDVGILAGGLVTMIVTRTRESRREGRHP